METINIQFQVSSTGQYTLDEFVAKLKDYAEKLASSISKSRKQLSGNLYEPGRAGSLCGRKSQPCS